MSASTPLRVGIVGCGYQGGILAQAVILGAGWQVVACADPDQVAAAQLAAVAGGAAVYASAEELLRGTDVDAGFVATSHDALYECSLAAIQAGKHVLVEKPIGLDEKEAVQLEEAVARTGVSFMAGYSFRYIPAWQKVRELLQAGAVGEVHTITGAIGIDPMSEGWSASPEIGGGPLLYVGSHLVDQILWCLGDVPVEANADIRYRADTRADETVTFRLRFASGVVAQGMVTQAGSGFIHDLDIWGRQGRISLRGVGFAYGVEIVSDVLPAYAQPTTIRFPESADLRVLRHQAQLAEFARAIAERRQPSCTAADGRRVLKVLDAITRSGRTGAPARIS